MTKQLVLCIMVVGRGKEVLIAMNKINYIEDDEDKIASHFAKASRQVVSLAIRTYIDDCVVHKKLVRAGLKSKIIKLQEALAKL